MIVHFYQPDSFLRTRQKTNPFFDPIVRVCEENGIEYRIFLPHCPIDIGYRKSLVSCTAWISVIGNIFWKVARIIGFRDPCSVYFAYAKVLRMLTVKRHTADIVISCGGALGYILSRLYPDSRVVDLQHGVIFSRHSGYFDKTCRLTKLLRYMPNREFWVYGQGYADCFFKHPDNTKDLQGRVKVIGDVIRAGESRVEQVARGEKNLIVIASQMTTDFSNEILAELKKMYEEVFDACPSGKKVVFRHHPRFGNCIDLSDWKDRYANVVFDDNREWREVFAEAACLVTVHSTTAFDAAAHGIPSVFLDEGRVDWPNVMKGEFEYPYPNMTISELCRMDKSKINEVSCCVRKWYERYYAPFDAERCLKLLRNEQ